MRNSDNGTMVFPNKTKLTTSKTDTANYSNNVGASAMEAASLEGESSFSDIVKEEGQEANEIAEEKEDLNFTCLNRGFIIATSIILVIILATGFTVKLVHHEKENKVTSIIDTDDSSNDTIQQIGEFVSTEGILPSSSLPTTAASNFSPTFVPSHLPVFSLSQTPSAPIITNNNLRINSDSPSSKLSHAPTSAAPSMAPTSPPITPPTRPPTSGPTNVPTRPPTSTPTSVPTRPPSSTQTNVPTRSPTSPLSMPPTRLPTSFPTSPPLSMPPTRSPTSFPTKAQALSSPIEDLIYQTASPPTNLPTIVSFSTLSSLTTTVDEVSTNDSATTSSSSSHQNFQIITPPSTTRRTYCGCDSCAFDDDQIWVGCRSRIIWLQTNGDYPNEKDACVQIATIEFPDVCGPKCNPYLCNPDYISDPDTDKLIWSDEFDIQNGQLDETKWTYDIGSNNGWGNNELQYYTNRTENVFIKDGILNIRARKEKEEEYGSYEGNAYTSARISTRGLVDWKYNTRIQLKIRLKQCIARGAWAAIWMLPTNPVNGVGWPDSGEIDIMEHVGHDASTIYGGVHTKKYNHMLNTQKIATTKTSAIDDWHIYEIIWTENTIQFTMDGLIYYKFEKQGQYASFDTWPFDQDFHLILNVAVGGNWAGNRGVSSTSFENEGQIMEVDYVRVYRL